MSATRSRRRPRDDRESLSPDPLLLTPSRVTPLAASSSNPHKRQKTTHVPDPAQQPTSIAGPTQIKRHWEESDSDDVDAEGEDDISSKPDGMIEGRVPGAASDHDSDSGGPEGEEESEEGQEQQEAEKAEDSEEEEEEEEDEVLELGPARLFDPGTDDNPGRKPVEDDRSDATLIHVEGSPSRDIIGSPVDQPSLEAESESRPTATPPPHLLLPGGSPPVTLPDHIIVSSRPSPRQLTNESTSREESADGGEAGRESPMIEVDDAGWQAGEKQLEPISGLAQTKLQTQVPESWQPSQGMERGRSLAEGVATSTDSGFREGSGDLAGPPRGSDESGNPEFSAAADSSLFPPQPGPPSTLVPSTDRSPTPPPASKAKQRKPTRVGTAPKAKKGTSVRSQMNALLHARYNAKGEIIESEDEQEKAVEEFMRETGGSIDVDGHVIDIKGENGEAASAPTSPMVVDGPQETSTTVVPPTPDVVGHLISEIEVPLAQRVISPPVKKQKKVPVASAASRTSLHMLLNATYNAKGEMIDPATIVDEARPIKKQRKAPEGETSARGKAKGKGKLVEDTRAATPGYTESAFDAEDSPFPATEESASLADPTEIRPAAIKRRGPGKKNKASAPASEAASSEPPGTPMKLNKKGSGKLETGSSGFATPEYTPEKPKKGGKRASRLAATTPPRSASLQSSLPEKEEAPSRRRKHKEDIEVEVEEVAEELEDETIYCICQKKFREDSSDMVECDLCQNWYHFKCMGMQEEKLPLIEQYVCPNCEADPTITERTSWKIKCRRAACNQPDRVPLSKYCSDVCGVHETLAKLDLKKMKIDHVWETVRSAPIPGGLSMTSDLGIGGAMRIPQLSQRQGVTFEVWKARSDSAVHAEIQDLDTKRSALEVRISLLEKQEEQLALAVAAADALPMLIGSAAEATENGYAARAKPGKRGKFAAVQAPLDEKACGFDVRLVGLEAAEPLELCMQGRKRCDRHVGWQKLRAGDLELERANLLSDIERIARRIATARLRYDSMMDGSAWPGQGKGTGEIKDNVSMRAQSEESDRNGEAPDIEMD